MLVSTRRARSSLGGALSRPPREHTPTTFAFFSFFFHRERVVEAHTTPTIPTLKYDVGGGDGTEPTTPATTTRQDMNAALSRTPGGFVVCEREKQTTSSLDRAEAESGSTRARARAALDRMAKSGTARLS